MEAVFTIEHFARTRSENDMPSWTLEKEPPQAPKALVVAVGVMAVCWPSAEGGKLILEHFW